MSEKREAEALEWDARVRAFYEQTMTSWSPETFKVVSSLAELGRQISYIVQAFPENRLQRKRRRGRREPSLERLRSHLVALDRQHQSKVVAKLQKRGR